ncbi:acyl-CoA dehydrogenase [Rhodopila sp.]|uniref:acyl-CoA dehydrogenase n=1 Tax=Rhodopila sp. TaxID=2480087 RepID=UPI003D11CA3F
MMPALADQVGALVPRMQGRAGMLDRDAMFPAEDIAELRQAGALSLALPVRLSSRDDMLADQLAAVLTLTGRGNLSVGRVLEAHLNTLHLIGRYGTPAQWQTATTDVQAGHLFALWVTDPPTGGLWMRRSGGTIRLTGAKQFCSAAGYATRTLVTAQDEDGGTRMLILRLGSGETVTGLPSPLQGMRAAVTGAVDFSGCETAVDSVLGQAGDYLREPDFSAGAWRGSAVALGGLIALLDLATEQLRASGRLTSPHVQARLGQAMIARETSRMWVRHAGRVAEDPTAPAGHRVATVGLGRIAVESACLDAMRLVQRSLGLSAFRQGNPVELLCRDLSTYLRQPAPDETLTDATRWFTENPTP